MKKILTLLLVLSLIFTFVACSDQEESSTTTNPTSATELSLTDILPSIGDHFKNGKVTVKESDKEIYSVSIEDVTEDEVGSFKLACRKGDFSDVSFSTKTNFQARTTDNKYYVSLQYLPKEDTNSKTNVVNIICGVVTSNTTAQDG